MTFDKIKFVRHFVRNPVPEFDAKAVSPVVFYIEITTGCLTSS